MIGRKRHHISTEISDLWAELKARKIRRERNARALYCLLIAGLLYLLWTHLPQ